MYYTGIDFDGKTLFIATVNKNLDLIDLKKTDNPSKTLKNVKRFYTSTSLSCNEVFIRNKKIATKKQKEARKIIEHQKQSLFTLDPEHSVIISQLKKNQEQYEAFYYISKEEHINRHLSKLKNFNIDPDRISCDAKALSKFIYTLYPQTTNSLIIHIKNEETSCVLTHNEFPLYTYHFNLGKKTTA